MIRQPHVQVMKSGFWVLTIFTLLFTLFSFTAQTYGGSRSLKTRAITEWVDQRSRSTRQVNSFPDQFMFSSVGFHSVEILRKVELTHHVHFLHQQEIFRSIKNNLLRQSLLTLHSKNEVPLSSL